MVFYMLIVFSKLLITVSPFPNREACEASGRQFMADKTIGGEPGAHFDCKPVVIPAGPKRQA